MKLLMATTIVKTLETEWYQSVYNTFTYMGLDNGVVLRTNLEVDYPFKEWDWRTDKQEYDICYWRKFWGFRNAVVTEFHQTEECADIPLNAEKVGKLRCILEEFLDREFYEDNADSIWDYEEYLIHNIECCENLAWLQNFLEEHPDEKCCFYDSY